MGIALLLYAVLSSFGLPVLLVYGLIRGLATRLNLKRSSISIGRFCAISDDEFSTRTANAIAANRDNRIIMWSFPRERAVMRRERWA